MIKINELFHIPLSNDGLRVVACSDRADVDSEIPDCSQEVICCSNNEPSLGWSMGWYILGALVEYMQEGYLILLVYVIQRSCVDSWTHRDIHVLCVDIKNTYVIHAIW